MITFSRVLPFDEYLAASRVANLHSTLSRRIRYIALIRVLPALAIIIVPLAIWLAIHTWQQTGDHAGIFMLEVAFATYGLIVLYCPFSFRRKAGKLFKRQGFEELWLVEVSPEGVHSVIKGQADSRIEWAYFNSCAETNAIFVLIRHSTGAFIPLPKTSLSPDEQDELRSIIATHLPVART